MAEGGRVVIVTEFSALPDSYRMVGVKLGIVMAGGLKIRINILENIYAAKYVICMHGF